MARKAKLKAVAPPARKAGRKAGMVLVLAAPKVRLPRPPRRGGVIPSGKAYNRRGGKAFLSRGGCL